MRKGYVKEDYWYDKNDQPHFLQNMEDSYLNNVVKFLEDRIKISKERFTEEQLKTNKNFLQDFRSLIGIMQEQEHRISVKETTMGELLYKQESIVHRELKEKFLESCGWFNMNNKWHNPGLIQPMDLQAAFLYESFKRKDEEDEKLFDSEVGF